MICRGRAGAAARSKVDLGLDQRLGVGFGDGGVEDVEIILFADEHLLAVRGELEAASAGKDRVGLVALVVDGETLKLGCAD